MDGPVPSKRPRLSIDVKPKVSWTQDEWTELLTDECSIKKERAHQIASKLAEQDFNTGRFSSFISEWQNNWEGCKGILLGIGFQDMEIVSFVALLRRHTEKATTEKQTTIAVVANRKKRPMCNELVWAVCKGIGVVKTSDRILLTSANIYAYLEKPFRKKIDQLDQNVEDELVVINQKQTESEYELWTNQLHILLSKNNSSEFKFSVNGDLSKNVQAQFFLQLIGPQIWPIVVNLTVSDGSNFPIIAHFLRKMNDCIEWVELDGEQFHLEPISALLNKFDKLAISIWSIEDQMRQFCDAFMRWINVSNGGQPKMCVIDSYEHKKISQLLDAVKKDFAGATHKQPFAMRIKVRESVHIDIKPLTEFILRNTRTREQLRFRRMDNIFNLQYILIRQWELNDYNQNKLEWGFDNIDEMDSICLDI